MDIAKAKADAPSPEIAGLLRQNASDMQALRVNRTPGFFVNGKPLLDFGAEQLKALVDRELGQDQGAIAAGATAGELKTARGLPLGLAIGLLHIPHWSWFPLRSGDLRVQL